MESIIRGMARPKDLIILSEVWIYIKNHFIFESYSADCYRSIVLDSSTRSRFTSVILFPKIARTLNDFSINTLKYNYIPIDIVDAFLENSVYT